MAKELEDKDVIDELISEDTEQDDEIDIEIDEEEKEIYDTKLAEKIERIKKKISLEGKRERKIDVDHKVVEERINNFVNKYDIENRIDDFVNKKIDEFHNEKNYDIIIQHANQEDYDDLLFDVELFEDIENFTKTIVRDALRKEFARSDLTETDRKILEIIDTHVELTLSDQGIDKLTLVAFHHFLKNLEKRAREFIVENVDKLQDFNRQKTATHLYNKEIINILSNHGQLAAFSMTIISLVSSWLEKYRQKSVKLGKFLNELMLMTSDVIIDKIARYILLIAIKNSSPIKFRSIFSTYLSLIHRNISSMLSANITNVKLGYFAKMQYLFEDNENQRVFNRHQMLANSILHTLKIKNRRKYKDNDYIIQEVLPFLSPNIIDFLEFAAPNGSIVDNYYAYAVYGRHLQNSDRIKAKSMFLHEDLVPRRNTSSIKNYLELKMSTVIEPLVNQLVSDPEEAKKVVSKLRTAISREINPKNFICVDENINDINVEQLYNEMDLIVERVAQFLKG